MDNRQLLVVQQYLSWSGHYRQYFENLVSDNYNYLYCSNSVENYSNSTWLKSEFDRTKHMSFWVKVKGRFTDSFRVFKFISKEQYEVIHMIEFEPLTYLLFGARIRKGTTLLLTIHSADKLHYSNFVHATLSSLQRKLLNWSLRDAVSKGAHIVNHYHCHKESILEIIGYQFKDRVHVIDYPAGEPKSNVVKFPNDLSNPKFLIYGQIREDKSIYEFLTAKGSENLNITIAGKILDQRIKSLLGRKGLIIIDRFLSDDEIGNLVDQHDFMLLPYPLTYTNGAGTFKDSLSMGLPVVTTNIPIFKEIIEQHHVGITFEKSSDIVQLIRGLDVPSYRQMSKNCLKYAFDYNWGYMRNSYFNIYERLLAKT